MLASGWEGLYVREDCISAIVCSREVNYINWIDDVYIYNILYTKIYIY